MKIDRVSLTLFAWDGIPPTRYHAAAKLGSGSSALGLLTIGTNSGSRGTPSLAPPPIPRRMTGRA